LNLLDEYIAIINQTLDAAALIRWAEEERAAAIRGARGDPAHRIEGILPTMSHRWDDHRMPPKPRGDDVRMINGPKIHQLIPANPGWWVRYRAESPENEWIAPIVAWALGENMQGGQQIYGVDPSGDEFHLYGDVVNQEAVYFYSPEPPPDALAVGDPGPKNPKD